LATTKNVAEVAKTLDAILTGFQALGELGYQISKLLFPCSLGDRKLAVFVTRGARFGSDKLCRLRQPWLQSGSAKLGSASRFGNLLSLFEKGGNQRF
jgi:hypothetical protein